MSQTGFQAKLEVNDGVAAASVKFSGTLTVTLPSEEAGEYESTELDQVDGDDDPDPVKRYDPTGLVETGMLKCELHYTKANHTRLRALLGVKGKTWKLTPPEDGGGPGTSSVIASGLGFLKKIDEINFEKEAPTTIKFEIRPSKKWTFAPPA